MKLSSVAFGRILYGGIEAIMDDPVCRWCRAELVIRRNSVICPECDDVKVK